jgi:hypothetical protein
VSADNPSEDSPQGGMGGYDYALQFRDIVKQVADSRIQMLRPPPVYAIVQSVNVPIRQAMVIYNGESNAVPMNMGSCSPKIGSVVRIEGVQSDRYTEVDILNNAATASSATSAVSSRVTAIENKLASFDYISFGLINSWANFGSPYGPAEAFKSRVDGTVHMRGLVKGGGINTVMGYLPVGWRPSYVEIYHAPAPNVGAFSATSAQTYQRIDVGTDGSLYYQGVDSSFVSLNQIIFLQSN